ncbi:hypothetical protein LMF89_22015 [Pelosinus sp. Bkl1]|uniref:Uncharacterized protein n=1 Tax=Pelosinus baikalensis TaxID=2892015 RepID=A0ABS8HXX2_9FIRM|nr:hypothetical protein [Pelosinus baikalensis]
MSNSKAPEVKYTCMKIADIYLLKDLLIDDKSIKNQLAAYSGQQIEMEIHNQ